MTTTFLFYISKCEKNTTDANEIRIFIAYGASNTKYFSFSKVYLGRDLFSARIYFDFLVFIYLFRVNILKKIVKRNEKFLSSVLEWKKTSSCKDLTHIIFFFVSV